MEDSYIISKVNEYLHSATIDLSKWLNKMLPLITDNWWNELVLGNLKYYQRDNVEKNNYTKLEQLDLILLLDITNNAWFDLRSITTLPTSLRFCLRSMKRVRNNWAHCGGTLPGKDAVIEDLNTLLEFFNKFINNYGYNKDITAFIDEIKNRDFSNNNGPETKSETVQAPDISIENTESSDKIKEKDMVYLVGDPDVKGMVFSIEEIEDTKRYVVFCNGELKVFYEGQIALIESEQENSWIDLDTFQTNLTAYEINNPSAGNLYSLNAARIDFVPYQFRPALKIIKSDEPRILIADSVGVGKTIEAGLIIKELEARNELDSVLIFCPKPLVTERKWELEMKRFDEDFTPLDGKVFRQAISDTHRDEEWPARYNKAIIPYSILDSRAYEGTKRGGIHYGLTDLDTPPHFDLVIIDEAHHLRNGSMEKDKAYAYKCIRYFCENADAVIMLTATPLQMGDDDLFTLLNLLRPDIIIDKDVFQLMSKPNEYIYRSSHAVRGAANGWQKTALKEMNDLKSTEWGENVISKNPLYADIISRLSGSDISREERVKLVTDIESLHSFNSMINRTRRKDIQDFCIRRSYTVETNFTAQQQALYDEILKFECEALTKLHDARMIPFLTGTIRRQAASCIYGLVPHLEDIINRRMVQLTDGYDFDIDELEIGAESINKLRELADHIISLTDYLSDEDPKFEKVLEVIKEKQDAENNKIIIFSTFRHTLAYIRERLSKLNYRVAQIDGSVNDDTRRILRERFERDREDPNALDILLFTEVGSEGLDYQFCDTMINYDLPWNPMRIEQRIGRIDRRGQKSEVVNIYNVITTGTVDADIYLRCLMRIGIFERSIGECEEVLGEIGTQIEKIALNTELTDEERRTKLEQMADNEIRKMQELTRLEDEERALFGFDLSNYSVTKDIKNADSPWISSLNIQHLVERYLKERLGDGQYIIGSSEVKQLRLNRENRLKLLEDFRKLPNIKSSLERKWENYLKGIEHMHTITFTSEAAEKDRRAFFITSMHPFVKQAAGYFAADKKSYIHLEYYSDDIPEGRYPFAVYAWSYTGVHPRFRAVPVSVNDRITNELIDLIQDSQTSAEKVPVSEDVWKELESIHIAKWQQEKERYLSEVKTTTDYKLESIGSNFRNRKRNLEQSIRNSYDEKIKRMRSSELESAEESYISKKAKIEEQEKTADIHTSLIANGIIDIKKEEK